jgi:hypothetical protein
MKHGTFVQTGILICIDGNKMQLRSGEKLAVAYLRLTPSPRQTGEG